jgi:hypothetical protein
VRRYGVELDAERALAASASGIETIQGNTFDAVAKPESFSLLYLSPPYDSEIGSVGNSRMERLFLEHTFRWLVMEGVLVLIIPFERLHECAGVLSSHFAICAVGNEIESCALPHARIDYGCRSCEAEKLAEISAFALWEGIKFHLQTRGTACHRVSSWWIEVGIAADCDQLWG